jgi:hypothetical protein
MKASRLFDLIPETLDLTFDQQRILLADLSSLAAHEACSDTDAVSRLHHRIGGWKELPGYANVLLAGERRKSNPVRISLPY